MSLESMSIALGSNLFVNASEVDGSPALNQSLAWSHSGGRQRLGHACRQCKEFAPGSFVAAESHANGNWNTLYAVPAALE